MTRKDFFFLSYMTTWSLSALILVICTMIFKWTFGNMWLFSPIFLSGLVVVAFLMSTNKKFNHWIFCESKAWAWMIKKHSFLGLVESVVGHYNHIV